MTPKRGPLGCGGSVGKPNLLQPGHRISAGAQHLNQAIVAQQMSGADRYEWLIARRYPRLELLKPCCIAVNKQGLTKLVVRQHAGFHGFK